MERIYETYLKIVKNACTDSHRTESVNPADLPTLAELAQNHCTVPIYTAISQICIQLSFS